MSDMIVWALRKEDTLQWHGHRLICECGLLRHKAADEIERLRMELMSCGEARGIEGMEYEKEIERLKDDLQQCRMVAAARDEGLIRYKKANAELQAALERIERTILGTPDQFKAIAREALREVDDA